MFVSYMFEGYIFEGISSLSLPFDHRHLPKIEGARTLEVVLLGFVGPLSCESSFVVPAITTAAAITIAVFAPRRGAPSLVHVTGGVSVALSLLLTSIPGVRVDTAFAGPTR